MENPNKASAETSGSNVSLAALISTSTSNPMEIEKSPFMVRSAPYTVKLSSTYST